MKYIIKSMVFATLCMLVFAGCEEGDGYKDVGISEIYIPQAAIPGANNRYTVPAGKGTDTYNFKVDNEKLNVFLSVSRGGKISKASGFSVNVLVSPEETDAAVAAEQSGALALSSSLYTIPGKVIVDAGKTDASFFLSIDLNALMDGTYKGKKLFLAVAINNPIPDTYVISKNNSLVIVVIDVDAMKPILFPDKP